MKTGRTARTTLTPSSLSATKIRVLCVDDSRDITAVLKMIIDAEPDMRCVGCLLSADRLISEVRRLSTTPSTPSTSSLVVILDANMPGKDPLKVMQELATGFPCVRTIIYSGYDDPEFVDRAIAAGASGCVSKRDEPEAITRAVREVDAGRSVRPAAASRWRN
ncbi:MAG: response regulator [Phycisphaerales bacterium]